MEAAVLKGGEEVAPVDLGLGEGDADPEHGALARGAEADGDAHRAGDDGAIDANFFIAGIEREVGISLRVEAAGMPFGELLLEAGGGAAGGAVFENEGDDRVEG